MNNRKEQEPETVAAPKQLKISIPDGNFLDVMNIMLRFCAWATEYKFIHPENKEAQEFIYGKNGFAIKYTDRRLDFASVRLIVFISDDGNSIRLDHIHPKLRTLSYDIVTVQNMIVDRLNSKLVLFCKLNNIFVVMNDTLHVPDDPKKTGPKMHKPIPIGARVKVCEGTLPDDVVKRVRGEVQGIASMNIFFVYILLLDEPIDVPDIGLCRCITMPGTMLVGEDGTSYQK
jgi:hypothetical protein